METKINMYYVQKGNKKVKCHYRIEENFITIYAKSYIDSFHGFFEEVENIDNSDSMTDYFEKARVRITPEHKNYDAIKNQILKIQSKLNKKIQLKIQKAKLA